MNVDASTHINSSPASVIDVSASHVSSKIKLDRKFKSNRTLPAYPPLSDAPTKKKPVRFSKIKRVRKIPHISTMPDKIIEDCWFGLNALEAMQISNNRIVYLMDTGESDLVEESESTRGLESKTQEGAWERYQYRQQAYDAVLDEQERQWTAGIEDPHIISHLYQEVSRECTNIALAKAGLDEKEIQEYLADTRSVMSHSVFMFDK